MSPGLQQCGMTLIELIIAMVIGLFIIAGVGEIFLSTRASYNVQERMGNLQESGRFGLFFLQRGIRKAGFPKFSALNAFTSTPSNTTCPVPSSTSCVPDTTATTTTATCNGTGSTPDQIAVCYQGAPGIKDCLGSDVTSGVATDVFYIAPDPVTGVNRLMCQDYVNGARLNTQPLVDGIENMQVQYGEDVVAPLDGYADRYVTANNVGNWDNVVSVRVSLLSSTTANSADTSGRVIGDTASDAQTYQLQDASGVIIANASGVQLTGVRGRVFTTTIELRNRTP